MNYRRSQLVSLNVLGFFKMDDWQLFDTWPTRLRILILRSHLSPLNSARKYSTGSSNRAKDSIDMESPYLPQTTLNPNQRMPPHMEPLSRPKTPGQMPKKILAKNIEESNNPAIANGLRSRPCSSLPRFEPLMGTENANQIEKWRRLPDPATRDYFLLRALRPTAWLVQPRTFCKPTSSNNVNQTGN